MNRYEQARSKMGAKAMESLRRATSTARRDPVLAFADIVHEAVPLRVSMSVEGDRFRVVVSRPSQNRAKGARTSRGSPPSWDALVAIRACVWPDEAEVHQVMPGADEPYVDIAECLHLFGPLPWSTP